jgi:voltage-gated potassium channel
MNNTGHLVISITLSLVILVAGTAGYIVINDWRFLDALYMTAITISTVGYREINQIGDAGRMFTILLVAIGVGFTLYVAAAVVQFMVEGRMRMILGRRRSDQKINRLKNHYIVCGYGRIGRVNFRNLRRKP